MIAKIGSSKCQFDTSPEALIQLRQNGVSAAVIKSMAGSGIPPAAGGGAASTLPPIAPGHQSQAGSVDASLNPPAQASPNTPASTAKTQPGLRQDYPNKTAADLRPVERIYTDIKLGKTTQPQHFGDIGLRLTKVNPATNTYSVEILSDHKMTLVEDKSINEIVQFNTARGGRHLVINQVTNDGIAGYLWREPLMATGCRSLQALKLKDVRNCFDVKLGKTLQPQRFGDITLKLESVDPKHNKYSVIVMAEDKRYEKKDKNANEPVQFYTSQGGHNPYELVINQINKDEIVGYLATPKDVPTVPPHNYFDVKLGMTLQPQRFADITLKLVNTDPEHNKYSVIVMAEDKRYEKKDKNANEAVQFYTSKGGHTPYELVINQITSDQIVGYLAVPKLTENGLPSQAGSADASLNPAAGTSPSPPEQAPSKQPSSGRTQVTGRVVWDGIPLPNASVQLWQAGDHQSIFLLASTVSAADGTFTMQEPPTGRLMIDAVGPSTDYGNGPLYPVTIVAGQTTNVGKLHVDKKLQLLSPANNATITTTTPMLQWTEFPGTSRYEVRVFNSTTHQRVFLQYAQSAQITVSPPLQSGQKYQWDVYAYGSRTTSIAYSSGGCFSIQETNSATPTTVRMGTCGGVEATASIPQSTLKAMDDAARAGNPDQVVQIARDAQLTVRVSEEGGHVSSYFITNPNNGKCVASRGPTIKN